MKIYIRAMSDELRDIKRRLSDASDQLNMHLLRVLLYPDADAYNHWKGEIYSFLHRVDRVKGRNRWPKEKQLLEWLSIHNDMIEQYVILVEDEESDLIPRIVDIRTLEKAVNSYDEWAASKLSSEGILRREDVYSKVDEIVQSTL